ncbi:MAG: glycosyl transferase family 2 [Rhodospirillales bacterium CG15_BIG_FIL_POST_REV_8_21_14_020_66_15]|nr:MAG: glycosyl transferase family 2 [Rhodospirillales bacterium CG15_BIG_FIL_POST_REV_8_21_14_020_66_15]
MTGVALLALAVWAGILFFRGRFWFADQHLSPAAKAASRDGWPAVVAVIPARDEADGIARTVASLLAQDYPGRLDVVVVDDNSADGTGALAQGAADAAAASERFHLVAGKPLVEGWSGKLWAVHQGLEAAGQAAPNARYVLLTDADISHHAANLRRLVEKAEMEDRDLVSLMVRLNCETPWERLLIPAFVFFFQKLFPFPWVNDPTRRTAAAAGGCMLVRRAALGAAGGIQAIRGRLIDDCALAELLKARGSIWLGLTHETVSLRRYDTLSEIWRMVARTAYEQLGHSPLMLLGTVAGMTLLYLVPPVAAFWGLAAGDWRLAAAGAGGWLAMAIAYFPTLRLYGRPPWAGFALPAAALLYTLMTVDSARRHGQGRGGGWKGRTYAGGVGVPDRDSHARFFDM